MTMAARAATVFTGKSSSKVLLRLIADNIEKNLLQIRLLPRNRLAHVDSEETRLAAGRVNKTQQHIHGCCLAGAVGAKEPEHFPCPNAQVEVLDGDLPWLPRVLCPILDPQVFGLNNWFHPRWKSLSRYSLV